MHVVVHRENHDLDLWVFTDDALGSGHAVEHRHGDVHDDDVGQQLSRHCDGLFTVLGLADDLFARCFEPPSNALAQDLMIVNQENSAHVLSCSFVDSVVTVMSVP